MLPPTTQTLFPWSDDDLAARVGTAVETYWRTRGNQAGTVGQTFEDARGGKHLDGFLNILSDLARSAGFSGDELRFRTGVELPGYFRPTKKWDLVVVRSGRLCAALELKSQIGPSFGNNFNNRTEEAVGSSSDLWLAYREGRIGFHAPWLGYVFLLEDARGANTPVKVPAAAFPPDPLFLGKSYAERYRILCERMVRERNYTAASLLLAPREPAGTFREAARELSFRQLAHSFYGHLVGCT